MPFLAGFAEVDVGDQFASVDHGTGEQAVG